MKFKDTNNTQVFFNIGVSGDNLNIKQEDVGGLTTTIMTLDKNALKIPCPISWPTTGVVGGIRYNSNAKEFQGYAEGGWGGLGGVKTSSGHTTITADDTNGLQFFTNNEDKMTILANGNVGIGTDSDPVQKLHVDGNTVVTGDITAYYSDERLKTFKGKITEPLDKIKQLNGYYFVENELAKSLGYDNDKLQVGVSAQEVEKVLPEIVTKAPIDNKYKTVWYQKLTPLLIEGMKEQQTQIETQQTQIESLQKQIDELKALINK